MLKVIGVFLIICLCLPSKSSTQSIELTWISSLERDIKYYVIYRDTLSYPMIEVAQVPATERIYTDHEVELNRVYYYRVTAVDTADNVSDFSNELVVSTSVVSAELPAVDLPEVFALHQNFPNPFNSETRLTYSLATKGEVSLIIFDLLGCRVRTLVNEVKEVGDHEATWDGRNRMARKVPSGIYFAELKAGHVSRTIKLLLQK